jgi:hypothetical protein
MTGTPIKNYVHQAFWLLWWTLGNASARFPYDYDSKRKFSQDFCVWEWDVTFGTKKGGKPKADVTNLAMLWKLLASSVIRRRMEETGEPIVATRYHEHYVPLGSAQRKQMDKWVKWFYKFFEEKYPDAKVVKSGAHKILAPLLGLQAKMDYAATIPLADPEYDWHPDEETDGFTDYSFVEDLSNHTPAMLRTLELAMALAKEGRKVLVGSDRKAAGKWIAEQLCEKGVKAEHIVGADGNTASKDVRADIVHSFQTSETQVFCAGIQAVRLGHNLDKGSAIVINGMPWDWESFDQYVKRVRRLTSERDIDVHLVIPKSKVTQTLTDKKWELLQQKGQAADLALDGRLIEKDIEEIKAEDVLKELMETGVKASGDEVDEAEVETSWANFPDFESYVPKPGITTGYTVIKKAWSDYEAWNAVVGDHTRTQLALPMVASPARELPFPDLNEEFSELAIGVAADGYDEGFEPVFEMEFAGGMQDELTDEETGSIPVEEILNEDTDLPEDEDAPEEEVPEDTKSPEVPPEPIQANGNGHANKAELIQAIKDLKELLDIEAVTPEEFQETKSELLAQLKGVS